MLCQKAQLLQSWWPCGLFMPNEGRSQVLLLGHSSKITCHSSGCFSLLASISGGLACPRMWCEFMAACSVFAQSRASHCPPAGLQITPACSQLFLVSYCSGFCYGSPALWWKHHKYHSGLLIQVSLHSPGQAPIHLWNRWPSPSPCFPAPWPSLQHCLRLWTPIHMSYITFGRLTSGDHPQSNGQTERANQGLDTTLCCITANHSTSWSSFLSWMECSHNSLTSSPTGMIQLMAAYQVQPPFLSTQWRWGRSPLCPNSCQPAQPCFLPGSLITFLLSLSAGSRMARVSSSWWTGRITVQRSPHVCSGPSP